MVKRILVPLDGSSRAEAILPHVQELATSYGAKVIFVRVIEPSAVIVQPHETHIKSYLDDINRCVEEVKAYLAARRGEFHEMGIEAEYRVMQGPVVESIICTAEAEDADLIAMASHGRGSMARMFYGSVAAGALHRADRPLLLIRAPEYALAS